MGDPAYQRIDAPATQEQKAVLARLSQDQVNVAELAGEPVLDRLTTAPGNGEPLGGIKVITESGWFAARPSGTEDVSSCTRTPSRAPPSWPGSRPKRSTSWTGCSRSRDKQLSTGQAVKG